MGLLGSRGREECDEEEAGVNYIQGNCSSAMDYFRSAISIEEGTLSW